VGLAVKPNVVVYYAPGAGRGDGLFIGVRGRDVLRTSPVRLSRMDADRVPAGIISNLL
jgi:hypothetical protein